MAASCMQIAPSCITGTWSAYPYSLSKHQLNGKKTQSDAGEEAGGAGRHGQGAALAAAQLQPRIHAAGHQVDPPQACPAALTYFDCGHHGRLARMPCTVTGPASQHLWNAVQCHIIASIECNIPAKSLHLIAQRSVLSFDAPEL